jgi:hypothetical protein
MLEVWIRPNQRALYLGWIVPLGSLLCGGIVLLVGWGAAWQVWAMITAAIFICIAVITGVVLLKMLREPRVAYRDEELWLYLQATQPIRVPIDQVECFFRGQGDGLLRGANGKDTEVATVIIRIAEAAQEWHHREVKPAFGLWCEGYITIRGTWCEPITPELMKRLNQRLVEVQRERKNRLLEARSC